jgi:ribosomal protein S18 acetylase RimI-like enzyme
MNYQFIEATKQHIETIAEFQIAMALETENFELNKETITKGVTAVFNRSELGKYFIIESNGEPIASLLITFEWSDWRNAMVWWIQSVYVIQEHRRKGVFQLMYDHIKTLVEQDDNIGGIRLYVDKTNIKAQKTYDKVGMNGDHYQLYEWMK